MAELNQQQVIDYIKGISVLELSQLVKALESELGVSAAAAVAVAAPGAGGRGNPARGRTALSAADRWSRSRSLAHPPRGVRAPSGRCRRRCCR